MHPRDILLKALRQRNPQYKLQTKNEAAGL